MKNFIKKTLLFLSPFIILQSFTLIMYTTDKGDLMRMAEVYDFFPNYRSRLVNEIAGKKYFNIIDDINVKNQKIDYFLIGDSFTNDDNGYKNYLGYLSNEKVSNLNSELVININPFESLSALAETNFFKSNNVKYVILESVERSLFDRVNNFDKNIKYTKTEVIEDNRVDHHLRLTDTEFPNKTIFTFPYHTISYILNKEKIDKVYRLDTNKELFSINKKEILLYQDDVTSSSENNKPEIATKLNDLLNKIDAELKKQNVKLIFLPAPDKLDAYYDNIINKNHFEKPSILEKLEKLPKNYIYVNPILTIKEYNKNTKNVDFYYYDDTHWSYNGAKEVAKQIINAAK